MKESFSKEGSAMKKILWAVSIAVAILVVAAFVYVQFVGPKMLSERIHSLAIHKTAVVKKPSLKQLKLILNLTDDEIVSRYGEPDQIIETGPDSIYYGYVYQKLGITPIFSEESNKPLYIKCSKSVSVRKAKTGMSFAQVRKRLGKAAIDRESANTWVIRYKLHGLLLSFKTNHENGKNSELQISGAESMDK
jgi:hypothetical protein